MAYRMLWKPGNVKRRTMYRREDRWVFPFGHGHWDLHNLFK